MAQGGNIPSVSPGTSVYDALRLMRDSDVGALIVSEGEEVVGVISERDCARKVLLAERNPRTTAVRSAMSSTVCSVTANKSLSESVELMIRRQIRHLPVYFGRYLVGCLSLRDLISWLILGTRPPARDNRPEKEHSILD